MSWFSLLLRGAGQFGPKALQAARQAAPKIAENPIARQQALALVAALPQRARVVPVTRQQRLAVRINAARDNAAKGLEAAGSPAAEQRAQEWVARADRLRSSLELAASTRRELRKGHLDRISDSLDALLAEMIEALGDSSVEA